ncbi:hypothetical protein Tco_0011580 [Tanacetum coccineum]
MIRMLQGIDKEDLEALWRIVMRRRQYYGEIHRPEVEFEEEYLVTTWKLIDSSGVHFTKRKMKGVANAPLPESVMKILLERRNLKIQKMKKVMSNAISITKSSELYFIIKFPIMIRTD